VDNYNAAIARLETVAERYPLFSQSDEVLIDIGDCWADEAQQMQKATAMPGAAREQMIADYENRAAAAYDKVVTKYPMSPHVEDARDRLIAMDRPVPVPSQSAIAESDAQERSRQPLHFTTTLFGMIKHGPTTVEAVHVGNPSLTDPPRVLATDINAQNLALYKQAMQPYMPTQHSAAMAATPTPANEPPVSGRPSAAPLAQGNMGTGTGVGVSIVRTPASTAAANPNALVQSVGPKNTVLPPVQKPSEAPMQVNDIKPGEVPTSSAIVNYNKKVKAPKANLHYESSSKKKKKRGLHKLNPF
jgi:outer membrane protein assembly factor BamD